MPRDVLKDGTDVTSWTDRRLLLRVVDTELDQANQIGRLATAQALTEKEVRDIKIRVSSLEDARAKAPSIADVEEIAQKAVDESGAHHVPHVEESESQRFKRMRVRMKTEDDAEEYQNTKAFKTKVYGAAAAIVLAAVVVAVLTVMWRLAQEHSSGVAEGKAAAPVVTVLVPMPPPSTALPPDPSPPNAPASIHPPPHHP